MKIGEAADFTRKYKVVQQLGEGGYGAVYLCQNRTTKQLLAVKIMGGRRITNKTLCPTRKEWLPNELVLWESLSHPNIVNLLDVYRDSKKYVWYLVMEYDPGFQDLFDFIDRNRSLLGWWQPPPEKTPNRTFLTFETILNRFFVQF